MYRLQWSWDLKIPIREVSSFQRVVCTDFNLMELGPEDVSLLERCPHFRGWYVQASMELEPEDVSLLERCPHFRGWYVQASMELGPEDMYLLERCPQFIPQIMWWCRNSPILTHPSLPIITYTQGRQQAEDTPKHTSQTTISIN